MQLGLFCSSNRPHLWGDLIKTLSNNSVDWNLCMAGPNLPIEPLPGNVKYIQTNVKPAQCYFIAAHNVVGDYISHMGDDVILSPGCLDDMVNLIDGKMTISSPAFVPHGDIKNKKTENHYSLWDARGYLDGDTRSTSTNKMHWGTIIPLSFPLPFFSCMHRETFDSIGIDKNYVAMWWNLDMAFELISKGGKIIISDTSYSYDFRGSGASLCWIACDLFYYNDMWVDQAIIGGADKIVRTTRKEFIDPLIYNDTVLTVSQGKVYPPLSDKGEYTVPRRKKVKIIPRWV